MKKRQFLFMGGFLIFALLISAAAIRSVYADDSSGNNNNAGENHGNVVSQIARGNEENENEANVMNESASIDSGGNFKITGAKVNSVNAASNSVNVTLYGFSNTVSLSGATILGAGKTIAVSDIQAGDVLSGSGNFNESTHAITVSQVNDVSYTNRNTANIQSQINNLLQLVQQLQAQLQALLGGGH